MRIAAISDLHIDINRDYPVFESLRDAKCIMEELCVRKVKKKKFNLRKVSRTFQPLNKTTFVLDQAANPVKQRRQVATP